MNQEIRLWLTTYAPKSFKSLTSPFLVIRDFHYQNKTPDALIILKLVQIAEVWSGHNSPSIIADFLMSHSQIRKFFVIDLGLPGLLHFNFLSSYTFLILFLINLNWDPHRRFPPDLISWLC